MPAWMNKAGVRETIIGLLLQAVVMVAFGTWYLGVFAADLKQADAITNERVSTLTERTSRAEAAIENVEGKVLREIKDMRSELIGRVDRIEDKIDARGRQR